MTNSQKRTIQIEVDFGKIFNEKVGKLYNEVRNSETVKQYYMYMLQTVNMDIGEKPSAKKIIESDELYEDNENIIKTELVIRALQKVFEEDSSFKLALTSEITQENILSIIDDLEGNIQSTLSEFCKLD